MDFTVHQCRRTCANNEEAEFTLFQSLRKSNAAWGGATRKLPVNQRIDAVVEEVVGGGEISFGEALRLVFPEATSGDVAPGADQMACEGLRVLVAHWVSANVPTNS